MMFHAFIGEKVSLPGRVLEGNMSKLKCNLIIMLKHVSLDGSFMTSFPHGNYHLIFGHHIIITFVWNNLGKTATIKVYLIELEEVGERFIHITPLVLRLHHLPREMCELWSHNIIQGEPINPKMSRQVWLDITNTFYHAHGGLICGYVCHFRYALEGYLTMIFTPHLQANELKVFAFDKVYHRILHCVAWSQEGTRGFK